MREAREVRAPVFRGTTTERGGHRDGDQDDQHQHQEAEPEGQAAGRTKQAHQPAKDAGVGSRRRLSGAGLSSIAVRRPVATDPLASASEVWPPPAVVPAPDVPAVLPAEPDPLEPDPPDPLPPEPDPLGFDGVQNSVFVVSPAGSVG